MCSVVIQIAVASGICGLKGILAQYSSVHLSIFELHLRFFAGYLAPICVEI